MSSGILVALVVAVGATCQVLSGVGFALVVSPLLMLAVGHTTGLHTTLILSCVLNLAVILRMPREVAPADALRLLVPAALVIPPMIALSGQLRGAPLNIVAGVAVLAATAASAAGRTLPFFRHRLGPVLAGGISGALNVLTGASGPPVALYAMARRWPPARTTATLQLFSLPLNLLTLVAVGLPSASQWAGMSWAAAGLVLGLAVSLPFVHLVPHGVVRWVTLGIATIGGITLLATA
ncbi:TSUP family transporter [Kineosporia sp. J2-2]|uniref:Probable membrane transporter protein n=1 Tax=Kineosporia corallincola TaxID=2835133 RepID=A0ABS5TG99_9ACTN|nr:TSUP family transporter [Kineosporia corallincola]MBT0769108.1 TSUP family transporter [Kineosporia corallincola]